MLVHRLLLILFLLFICPPGQAQNSFIPNLGSSIVPEHGFLKGKKFKMYPTIGKYDFSGRKVRLELYDNRESLKLTLINCSYVEVNNLSEFKGEKGFTAVRGYFQKLFSDADIIIDSMSKDTLKVELQALDSRLIGFGNITAHGLCQMAMTYKTFQNLTV